jgi:DNA-binding response OmpR family regulator
MNLNKILLVEDDPNLGQILKDYLEVKGFEPTLYRDGRSALRAFKSEVFQLCIFDVMMPIMDGFTLAEEVRKIEKDVPIIFLTAKSMKEDTIRGFQIGADDYITKPFSMEELLLRINAVMRRSIKAAPPAAGTYQIGNFTYDTKLHTLTGMGEEIKLTSKEAELLEMLCQYKNQVLERSKALRQIWGDDNYFNSRSMDVYITKLRKYLKADERIQIMNIHGTGYKLIVPED